MHFFSNEIPAFATLSVPFTCTLSADVLNKQVYSQVRTQKKQTWRSRSWPSAPSKEQHVVVLAQKLHARQVVILSIMLCFLLCSRCPTWSMASAWLQHSATVRRRGLARWLLLSHPLKGEKLWGCCLAPALLGLLLLLEAPQNSTGNILFTFTPFCDCAL